MSFIDALRTRERAGGGLGHVFDGQYVTHGFAPSSTHRVPTPSPASSRSTIPACAPGRDHDFADPAVEAIRAGCQFGLHAAGGDSVGNQPAAIRGRQVVDRASRRIPHAFHVSEEEQPVGPKADRARHRHLVGIDVVDAALAVARYARHHRQVPVAPPATREGPRSTAPAVPRRRAPGPSARPRSGRRRCRSVPPPVRRPATSAATSSWLTVPASTFSTASITSGVDTRSPLTKRLSTPRSLRKRVICLPPPCTTTTSMPCRRAATISPASRAARRRVVEQRAAQLHQDLHSRPSVSANPSTRFMFCIAWPAAPFTRLSMQLTTTPRPVRASNFTPISQKLVRWHRVQVRHHARLVHAHERFVRVDALE